METNQNITEIETLNQDILTWVDTFKFYYQKYLASCILDKKELLDEDMKKSYQFFLEDFGLLEKSIRPELNILINIFEESDLDSIDGLWLEKISDFKDVSAVTNNQVIEFSKQLTVMFGENGAGKSSYVRLLNNTFNSRGEKEILPNIYRDGEFHKPSCKFHFEKTDNKYVCEYPEHQSNEEFECFTVFDSLSVRAHLDNKNEYIFTPKGFEFFNLYTNGLEKIKKLVEADISSKRRENPFKNLFKSQVKEIITGLNSETDLEEFKKDSTFTNKDVLSLQEMEKQKAKLLALEINKKIRDKKQILDRLNSFLQRIKIINSKFSKENLDFIDKSIIKVNQKKKSAKKMGIDQFQNLTISNVGTSSWKNFIQAAKSFTTTFPKDYPLDEDHCVFCSQSLTDKARLLISSYWKFLESTAQDELKQTEAILDNIKKELEILSFDILDDDSYLRTWIHNEKGEATLKRWDATLDDFENFRDKIITRINSLTGIEDLKTLKYSKEEIEQFAQQESKEIEDLSKQNPDEEIQKLTVKITFFQERKLLSNMISSISEFVNELKWISVAQSKTFTLNTRKATVKQKELFNKYITDEYLETFKSECKKLNAEFGITINQEGRKGNTFRELKIMGHSLKKVLSEGEQRAISLADFLTEIKVAKNNKGIFFDDPVNSLDHKRKRNIANRLAEESKSRQVIIFTHDMIFLHYIKEAASNFSCDCKNHWIKKESQSVGLVYLNNSPSNESDYKKTGIAREFYRRAKTAPPQEQEHLLKQGFGALRTNYEAFVIFEIFNGVVERFGERISIGRLKDVFVNPSIAKTVESKTGELSRFIEGHLHSDLYVPEKPAPQLLLQEIEFFENLKKQHKEFCKTCKNNN